MDVQMTKEQLQEQQALRIAAAREICRKGRGQVQEGGTGSPVTHSGASARGKHRLSSHPLE
eukprot:1138875-Pelagomonas_calceolata.AAC.8